ncbi:hypothetical protein RchiOBHm_Chr7g0196351 [Rosa chinensis]|uniref:Uncharacterized protein n=1 Tax=Rosa chinensis TaxID=74649 RepID=A0A2P6P6N7_ROSCH|nr:hypothetical protein RchiOBHm_Chr7g0196351 [Rosa chinensis]
MLNGGPCPYSLVAYLASLEHMLRKSRPCALRLVSHICLLRRS